MSSSASPSCSDAPVATVLKSCLVKKGCEGSWLLVKQCAEMDFDQQVNFLAWMFSNIIMIKSACC